MVMLMIALCQHTDKAKDHHQQTIVALCDNDVFAFESHMQSKKSTGTMKSEVKCICTACENHVVPILELMQALGLKQAPSIIYKDNSAVVTLSKAIHLIKRMRHLPLWLNWIQELQHNGIIMTTTVKSKENLSNVALKLYNIALKHRTDFTRN